MKNKPINQQNNTFVIVGFIAGVAGVIVSWSLLKEDVFSTAKTLFEYFPLTFGVTPASTWEGAQRLGWFTTILQIVAGTIAFTKGYNQWLRLVSVLLLGVSVPFDNWTDVVYRSGFMQGNPMVAFITTAMFYTVGSELLQSFAWVIIISTWRQAIREIMRAGARVKAGVASISGEWDRIKRIAENTESREIADTYKGTVGGGQPQQSQSGQSQSNRSNQSTQNNPRSAVPQNNPTPDPRRQTSKPRVSESANVREPTHHPISYQQASFNKALMTLAGSKMDEALSNYLNPEKEAALLEEAALLYEQAGSPSDAENARALITVS